MSKVIVITGAGVGLGRALARALASQGEQVVLLGRTLSKVEAVAKEIGESATAIMCDVSSPESVRDAFSTIRNKFHTIDVLINNAAVFEPFTIVNATDSQIFNAIATNLAGPMYCTRSAIPLMQSGSAIFNVTSESVEGYYPHLSVYQSTKAGLERFSKSMHHELTSQGIRVFNVRAGQMFEEGKTWDVDPEAREAFGKAANEAGLNFHDRPISHFASVTEVFRTLMELPADLHVANISLSGRKPD